MLLGEICNGDVTRWSFKVEQADFLVLQMGNIECKVKIGRLFEETKDCVWVVAKRILKGNYNSLKITFLEI